MTRKEVVKDVDFRVNSGELKCSAYSAYAMRAWKHMEVKRRAILITLTSRKKCLWLNNVFIGLFVRHACDECGRCRWFPRMQLVDGKWYPFCFIATE